MMKIQGGIIQVLCAILLFAAAARKTTSVLAGKNNNDDDHLHSTILSNGKRFPQVGLGVGNLQHDLIMDQIQDAMHADKKTTMFDTAHASKNEEIIREAVKGGLKKSTYLNKRSVIHVVTKVWYTHLGYDRTILAVKESLQNLQQKNIRVHILIHWPRCNDGISWMNCEQEENDLPESVRTAGPAPHLNRDTAFLESWRALEDIYLGMVNLGGRLPKVESIGVSNFSLEDMKALEGKQRVAPQIYQGNVFYYLFDPYLMAYLRENNIHFQAFNIIHGIFYDREYEDAPNAIIALNELSQQLSTESGSEVAFTLPQLVLKWLVQDGISVVPRTSNQNRLLENSAVSIAAVPALTALQIDTVRSAVGALLKKEDLMPPLASFFNRAEEGVMNLFWLQEETGEEVLVRENLGPGDSYGEYAKKGHTFIAVYKDTGFRKEYVVNARNGQEQRFDVTPDL